MYDTVEPLDQRLSTHLGSIICFWIMGMASTVSQLGLCHNWMISVDMDMREEKGMERQEDGQLQGSRAHVSYRLTKKEDHA